jgi:capsular polysaccharide transport system ATP-binding protein
MSIDLVNISKTYVTLGRRRTVFKNFSLTIPKGLNLGVIGPNGSGKSTLLSIIAGQLHPDVGRVVRNMSVSWPVGYSGAASPNLTGTLNCRFIARLYGKDPDEITQFVAELSELQEYMDWPVKTYSSGMRGRLNFALSMAIDFDCLLVDEGLGAGDQFFREKAESAIAERRKRASLLYVTHNLGEVIKLCDRVLVLGGPKPDISDDVEGRVKQYQDEYSLMRRLGKAQVAGDS